MADGSWRSRITKLAACQRRKKSKPEPNRNCLYCRFIAERGGFEGVKPAEAGALAYWQLVGGRSGNDKETAFTETLDA